MKILCPVDFSNNSKKSFTYALNLTKLLDAELHVLHAYKLKDNIAEDNDDSIEVATRCKNEMDKLISAIISVPSIHQFPVCVCQRGETTRVVNNYVKNHNIDLVIMGSQGRGSIANRVFGSTAKKIINILNTPVLVIPFDYKSQELPSKLLIALDNEILENESGFIILNIILKALSKNIDILHLYSKEDEFPFDPFITKYLKGLIGEIHLIKERDIDFGIVHFIKENDYDFLTMVKRGHGLMRKLFGKNHTDEEVARSFIPTLIIPE